MCWSVTTMQTIGLIAGAGTTGAATTAESVHATVQVAHVGHA